MCENFRRRQQERDDYDHEKEKEIMRLRVAATRARRPKCPLGRKCKDSLCTLHPDRGRNRRKSLHNSANVSRTSLGLAHWRANQRHEKQEQEKMQIKVKDLVNSKRQLKHRLQKIEKERENSDGDADISLIMNCMTPNSKSKTPKRMATKPGMTQSVRKQLRKGANFRIREERLFTYDEMVPEFGEKVIAFMMDNDNSFESPDKKKEGVRYRRDTIEVLHEKFMGETMIECSLHSFGRYVPSNILKSKLGDWGFVKCVSILS